MKRIVANSHGKLNLDLTVVALAVNLVVIFLALGTAVYTRFLFQRPAITEQGERKRIDESKAELFIAGKTGFVYFKKMTLNIMPNPENPAPAEGGSNPIEGKMHYAEVAFALEIRDKEMESKIEAIKPFFMDQILQLFAKKSFADLTSVHGRFLVRTEVLELANKLLSEPLVTNVFFTHFTVQ